MLGQSAPGSLCWRLTSADGCCCALNPSLTGATVADAAGLNGLHFKGAVWKRTGTPFDAPSTRQDRLRCLARALAMSDSALPQRVIVDADAPLIERVKRGDVRAFEMLVVKYQRRIERLIGRMVRDVDLVPDIAQETFIRAYRAIPQFRGDSAFYTWLYRIAVNTAKKSLMELKRDPTVSEAALASRDDDDETSRVENELTDGETPESILASKQIAGAVNSAIDALSDDLRQAITLREIEGLSYEEIAEVMNCPIGTVRSRIFRAREAISQRLRPMLDTREGERW